MDMDEDEDESEDCSTSISDAPDEIEDVPAAAAVLEPSSSGCPTSFRSFSVSARTTVAIDAFRESGRKPITTATSWLSRRMAFPL